MESMGDDWADIQTALQHYGHFVPGLVHLAAVNAFYCKHREYNRIPINSHLLLRNTEHRDLSSVAHVGKHVSKGRSIAGHFKSDIEPFVHAEFLLDRFKVTFQGIHCQGHAHLAGQLQPMFVHVGNNDITSPSVPHNSRCHDADGTSTSDEDVLAEYWK